MARPSSLPAPAETLVLHALRKNRRPMTAYALLDGLKAKGIKSPPTIYRALENLIQQGKAHKIHELNVYVACNCEADHQHSISILTVCGKCQQVEERHDHALIRHMEKLPAMGVALQQHAVIELPVYCSSCV